VVASSAEVFQWSVLVQKKFNIQMVVMAHCAVRRGRPQDRKNDRKTTGFTKPLKPELNLGKEKVKVW
jgi:hypothetical protein